MLDNIAIESAKKILMNEIDTINPKCIVVLGKTALYAIQEISKEENKGKNWNLTPAHDFLKNIKNYKDDKGSGFTLSMQKELCKKGILVMPFLNDCNKNTEHRKKLID